MGAYIIRRLLLMVVTLLGISIVVFAICQMLPGGPLEQYMMKIQMAANESGASVSGNMTEEEIENIKKNFGYDKPALQRYFSWLGGILTFDLGESFIYRKPVGEVIRSKFPISLMFGLVSIILAYSVSIPLGMLKARKHETAFDGITSALIFVGFVIPGFALGVILLVFLGGGSYYSWFPIAGVKSDDWEEYTRLWQILDYLHHMALPLFCYCIGSFAILTMLMKNTLLDESGKDYVRTALCKGLDIKKATWKHVFRNALIPIVTGLGTIFTVFFSGSLLIEKVFSIDGMGLLMYNSMLARDFNVVMGVIFLTSVLILIGRLFSDLLYAVVDPRIRFD